MPRVTRRVPLGQTAVTANLDVSTGKLSSRVPGSATAQATQELSRAVQQAGATVTLLNQKAQDVRNNRDTAKGIASYNNIVNTYNESLVGRQTDDYVSGFEELKPQIDQITDGMSPKASAHLQNRFEVFNEANRNSLAIKAIKQETAEAKFDLPGKLRNMVANGQTDEAHVVIENYEGTVLTPGEVELWKDKVKEYQRESNIFSALNVVSRKPTQENFEFASKVIEENTLTEKDRFSKMNTLRATMGEKTRRQTEAVKAEINSWAQSLGANAATNDAITVNVPPELELTKIRFNERLASSGEGMEWSDDFTFDSMQEQSLAGKFFTDREMTESYAQGMSTEEYTTLKEMNGKNKQLPIEQKNQLNLYNEQINERYSALDSLVRSRVSFASSHVAGTAISTDKLSLKKEVKQMVMTGESGENIQIAINARLEGGSRSYTRGLISKVPFVNEFTTSAREETSTEEQNRILLDVLKEAARTNNIPDNFDELVRIFSEERE